MRVQSKKSTGALGATLALFCLARPARAQVVTEFPLLDVSDPTAMTRGPDGNLWFTVSGEYGDAKIGRVTPSGAVSLFSLPGVQGVQGIAAGPDGSLWFTESAGNRIGRMTTRGDYVEFAVPTPGAQPWGISPGPDGNIWFTERGAGQIGKVTLSDVNPYTLRLGGDRFLVTVAWQSPPESGPGHPVSLTPQAGYFWFSDPANVEVVVKILDWCPAGGIKFFAAGLTNLGVSVTVIDSQTGQSRTWVNPQRVAFQAIEDDVSTCSTGGSIAGEWTGDFDSADFIDCDSNTPARASFQQNGATVIGHLNAAENGCGFMDVLFQGTLQGNALEGTVAGDRFSSGSTASGTLTGDTLEISIVNGFGYIPGGQMHLRR